MIANNSSVILTERLILRRFCQEDIDDYFKIMNDKHTNIFLPWLLITTTEDAEKHLYKNYINHYSSPSSCRYAICMKTDNKPIGYIKVGEGDSYDFGYGLRHEYWHLGIVTEAAKAVVESVEKAGYKYITATHDVNNPRSGEVMRKVGMTYRYSYVEQWQPKDFPVTFRMYQKNFDGEDNRTYSKYWDMYPNHFIELHK